MSTSCNGRYRSLSEWYSLVTEARQSGLSDAEWCRRNNISRNTFNNAVKRLRKKAYAMPERNKMVMDFTSSCNTSSRQEVVKIGIVGNECEMTAATTIDQTCSPDCISINFPNASIRIQNGTDPYLVSQLVSALRSCL